MSAERVRMMRRLGEIEKQLAKLTRIIEHHFEDTLEELASLPQEHSEYPDWMNDAIRQSNHDTMRRMIDKQIAEKKKEQK